MYDVSQIQKRYFDIRLLVEDEGGKIQKVELQVEPPSVKMMDRLTSVAEAGETEAMKELSSAVRDMLSKNKSGFQVPDAYVEKLDIDQLTGILEAYMEWVAKEKKAKN